jgi:hypothetical protein
MKDQQKQHLIDMMRADEELGLYDEPKQETLHEVALEFAKDHCEMYETSNLGSMYFGFCWGAKWQQEKMYSEEEVYNLLVECSKWQLPQTDEDLFKIKEWFDTIKKK